MEFSSFRSVRMYNFSVMCCEGCGDKVVMIEQ